MGNFLLNLGAGIRGMQDYEKLQLQQQALKDEVEQGKLRLENLKEATERAKKLQRAEEKAGGLAFEYLGGGRAPVTIPPPPNLGAPQIVPDMPPPVQAPMPGQQSQPMMRAPIGPPGDMGGLPPPPQAMFRPPMGPDAGVESEAIPMRPPIASTGPETAQGGPAALPVAPQPIQPYRTLGGAPTVNPPMAIGIPPPPATGEPRPKSMSLQDAAQFIKSKGIDDPLVGIQVLEKLTPYLNNEARQEANMLRMEMQAQQKAAELQAKIDRAEMESKDRNASIEQRREAAANSNALKKELGGINAALRQQAINVKKGAKQDAAASTPGELDRQDDIEVQAWKFLTKGESPPARSPDYKTVMQRVALIAKDNGLSPQEIISASADVKSKLAAKKNFEIRAQNMERAENQILAEIPLIRDAAKSLNLPSIPLFAKGGMAALRQLGDPRVTQLDQAVETVFNEFEGIRTGNPGALNVSDVQNARHAYENAKTPQQLEAAIVGIERTITNAKKAMATTRQHILDDVNATFKRDGIGGYGKEGPKAPSVSGSPTRIKNADDYNKLPSGALFYTPDGVLKRKK